MPEKTTLLGKEHDEALRDALRTAMQELGGNITDNSWGVAGSQEGERLDCVVEGKPVFIESETYIGLSIRGESDVVDRIASRVGELLNKGK